MNGSTCANMAPAVLLKRVFSPILKPFTIPCARIPRLDGFHRALLNCACAMPLPPDLRDFMYYCDSFRFFALFTVYFFGKGSKKALLSITDNSAFSAKRSLLLCRMQITLLSEQWPVARRTVLRPYDPSRRTTK